jgi:uncharacterized MAPEG superfamily protein
MTTDLWMLIASGMLGAALPLVYLTGRVTVPGGLAWAFGNRETVLPVQPWVARAVRAHNNLTENLGLFAILVLVAHVTGKANATTALGAELFFFGRVAHIALYTAGAVYLRTAAYFVGVAGEILILLQLFH